MCYIRKILTTKAMPNFETTNLGLWVLVYERKYLSPAIITADIPPTIPAKATFPSAEPKSVQEFISPNEMVTATDKKPATKALNALKATPFAILYSFFVTIL